MSRAARRAADRGSATVWAALVVTVLGAVFGGVLLLGQAVVARHRAAAAADLAALAAAASWTHGPQAACATAARVAGAQGARVTACVLTGETAQITARAATGPFTPPIQSRAGPPTPPLRRAGAAPGTGGGDGPATGAGATPPGGG
ncbi:Rv3654c family TadE-like protein [Streptomyces sp. NPDC060031]|uniref:Rv3654c family TadE-like protein n=1 Tax=Streptomyces sp. NPDC060031 TaxID=3347043 RepID=UPI00369DA4CF